MTALLELGIQFLFGIAEFIDLIQLLCTGKFSEVVLLERWPVVHMMITSGKTRLLSL